ncbi:hypothetical protein [uncultured Lutibacter sp.]|uniref:hypothetical protein n=1 Tax=uncultured Lutibacter sp. TaxID=437739 RepID=UPI0026393CDE|nr:hypothetical protein [uncultured Lutibacter sp.]
MSALNVAFTICSNNYLAQANALKKSFLKYNPNFTFYIFLVDELVSKIDYSLFKPAIIKPVESIIKKHNLDVLIEKYNIIELNTCIKPSMFKYIISNNPKSKIIYYLDPDLYFYASLNEVNNKLKLNSIALTPHIMSPIERDGHMPDENVFLNFGIYNLGFIGINAQHNEAQKMLNWWEERTLNFGFDNTKKGYFVDQLWMNLTPLFFKDVVVLKSFGYNMGPWNLHERKIIEIKDNKVLLNDNSNLVFYHFSKLAANTTDISREYNRYSLLELPLISELYYRYKTTVENFNYSRFNEMKIAYKVKEPIDLTYKKGSIIKRILKKMSVWLSKIADKF